MGFSQATLVGEPVLSALGTHLRVSWATTSPPGTLWQVYIDRRLAWRGKDRTVLFPMPPPGRRVDVEVGAVGPGEGSTDFSASLPAGSPDRARLDWPGDPAVREFRVFGSAVAGGPVDYSRVLGVVPATVAGVDLTGWGLGGWGMGLWGHSYALYSWTSARLGSGVWTFDVLPVDAAGNLGTASVTSASVTVVAPPGPPAPGPGGARLRYAFDPATGVPTLSWNASPG